MKQHVAFIIYTVIILVVQFLLTSHLFVTYAEMTNYAVPRSALEHIAADLDRIEQKLDKVILGY